MDNSNRDNSVSFNIEAVTVSNSDLAMPNMIITTAPGNVGEIRITVSYIYTCITTNTWVRSPVETW